MKYVAIFGSLFLIVLIISFSVRTNHWRNRRKAQRRVVPDRRVNPGRRKQNSLEHESSLPDRRKNGDRRIGPATRRHKRRRSEDRHGQY